MKTLVKSAVSVRATPRLDLVRIVLQTTSSFVETALRVTLGVILLPHGAQHLLGTFGGFGFVATVDWMTGSFGFPAPLAGLGIVLEFVGPIALVLGAGARLAASALAIFMAVAASTHVSNGFFMNWFGALPAGVEGYEYHLLVIALTVAVAARGAGAWSIDNWLTRRAPEPRSRSAAA